MKKIVIVGGLGYVGTELCRIYSGESWKNKIIVIDNRFISERVNELNNWNIEFFQGELFDINFLKKHLSDADIVHHLAGITDVAYTQSQSNKELDKKIRTTSVIGTNNILKSININCKLIFPSTHVIFEGLLKTKKNILEDETPKPLLAYSSGKVQNEKDITNSGINYIILRLGSVYGYSHDTMRINIMPNLFSKITSQNGIIKLFGGGKQIKSLVSLKDVVRCMKFMADQNDIKRQIFHLVNEKVTVKDVASICKKINPNVKITKTNDEVPNLGYTLSNRKLLRTGFKFLYSLEESIKEMVGKWLYQKKKGELEYVSQSINEFIDERGKISNFELPEPINLIGLIKSKKRSLRANHFHPIQEQKCLLIKGQFISIYKDLLSKNSNKISHIVNEGDIIITQPNVAHTMIFTKESVFLNLVRGERDHDNYGITHTIPYQLISRSEKKNILKFYKFDCRVCGNTNLKRFLSLGFQPLANNLAKKKNEDVEKYPLEINFCSKCFNCQLSVAINPKKMFKNYLYLSSTTQTFKAHFENAAKKYIKYLKLKKNSFIIDVGSNDGVGLIPFKNFGYNNLLGIEPAKNLCKISQLNGIRTHNDFLNEKILKKIKRKADLVLASNVFAHSDELKNMAKTMIKLLSVKGVIIIEVQYLLKMLRDLTFDNIYHEHFNYWSLTCLKAMFEKLGAKIFKVEEIETHGGSLRVYITKFSNKKINIGSSVNELLIKEEKFGIKKFDTFKKFGDKIYEIKKNVIKNIQKLKLKGKTIVGYGAPAKATTAINFFGISSEIEFIIEDNKLKQNKFVPGTNLQIYPKAKIKEKNSIILVLAWNFFSEIKKNNYKLSDTFISIKDLEK